MYDPAIVDPMRKDLVNLGFAEMRTTEEVDQYLQKHKGTTLIVINSICGCAAGAARPALALALESDIKPDQLLTVFAGQDKEATTRVREYFVGWQPDSPQFTLYKNGKVAHMMQRDAIEGCSPEDIATELQYAFRRHCLEITPDIDIETFLKRFAEKEEKLDALLPKSGHIGAGLSEDEWEDRLEAIEDILDEEAPLDPPSFTTEGATKMRALLKERNQQTWAVKFEAQGLDLVEKAALDEVSFESSGLKIVVARKLLRRFAGTKLHFDEANGGFCLL